MEQFVKTITIRNGKVINFRQFMWKKLQIVSPKVHIKLSQKDNQIVKITFDDEYIINVGDHILLNVENKDYKFYVNYIMFENNAIYLLEALINDTTTYIYPLLGHKYTDIVYYHLINAYLRINLEENIDNKYIYIVFKYIDSKSFQEIEQFFKNIKEFVKVIEPNYSYTIYKLKIPEEFQNDVDLIIEGKYSQISDKAKQRIINVNELSKSSFITKILYKDEKLKKEIEKVLDVKIPEHLDLYNKMEITNETFDK